MYRPNHYKQDNQEQIDQLINEAPFATLLTLGGHTLSHLPLLLQKGPDQSPVLLGHMAYANPQWQELLERGQAKAVFQGPHGYISPAWYTPKPDNVPTWNYAVVHVTGKFEVVEDPHEAFRTMTLMVDIFESEYGTQWQMPASADALESLMKAIVVFKIRDLQFQAKFKLSQKQNKRDRQNVISNLRDSGDQTLMALAEMMGRTSK